MADNLYFMMGEFQAEFPTDRLYAKNHMWAKAVGGGVHGGVLHDFGFTAYAVRLLQDVYFLDWDAQEHSGIVEKEEMGQIESKKAEASLYAPIGGFLGSFNQAVVSDPSMINVDPYGDGWLFSMEANDEQLLSPDDYLVHLEAVWEVTQRTIKGQMNE